MGSSHISPTHNGVKTSSRLRAWYLVQFRRYNVVQHREIPRVTRLGRLTYENQWILRPAHDTLTGQEAESAT